MPLERILESLLLAILVARAGFFLVYSLQAILFPFPIDYDEGVVLHSSMLLARGAAVYRPLEAGAFVSSAYTPLFYLLTAPFLALFGPTLAAGRAVALLSTLGSVALLYALARHLGGSRPAALTAALIPLSIGTTLIWSTLAKPDTLALFFIVLTLYWAVRFEQSRWLYGKKPESPGARAGGERPREHSSRRRVSRAGFFLGISPLFTGSVQQVGQGSACRSPTACGGEIYLTAPWVALAFFAKQNTVLLTGLVLLWILWRSPRRGLALGALAGLLTGGPFLLAHLLTDGAFFLHTWGLHQLPWQWEQLWRTAEPLLVMLPGLVLLAAGGPWHLRRQGRAGPALLFLGGGLLFLLTGGRIGTNWSFQLPLLLAMALCAGLPFFPARQTERPRGYLLLLALAVVQFALLPNPLRWYRTDLLPSAARRQALEEACALIARTPPPILSEDVGMLLLCGHEPRYDDPFMMAQLSRAGRWDETSLVRQIEEEHFTLVILAYDLAPLAERNQLLRWPAAPLAALRDHYVHWQERGGLHLYRPRGDPTLPGVVWINLEKP